MYVRVILSTQVPSSVLHEVVDPTMAGRQENLATNSAKERPDARTWRSRRSQYGRKTYVSTTGHLLVYSVVSGAPRSRKEQSEGLSATAERKRFLASKGMNAGSLAAYVPTAPSHLLHISPCLIRATRENTSTYSKLRDFSEFVNDTRTCRRLIRTTKQDPQSVTAGC